MYRCTIRNSNRVTLTASYLVLISAITLSITQWSAVKAANAPDFDISPTELPPVKQRVKKIGVNLRDRSAGIEVDQGAVRVCGDTPKLTFDVKKALGIFAAAKVSIKYQSVEKNQLIILTYPEMQASGNNYSYYIYSLTLEKCRLDKNNNECSLHIVSNKYIAPFQNSIIMASQAKSEDDSLTKKLISETDNILKTAVILCDYTKKHEK
jgi:hypothetical protein